MKINMQYLNQLQLLRAGLLSDLDDNPMDKELLLQLGRTEHELFCAQKQILAQNKGDLTIEDGKNYVTHQIFN